MNEATTPFLALHAVAIATFCAGGFRLEACDDDFLLFRLKIFHFHRVWYVQDFKGDNEVSALTSFTKILVPRYVCCMNTWYVLMLRTLCKTSKEMTKSPFWLSVNNNTYPYYCTFYVLPGYIYIYILRSIPYIKDDADGFARLQRK